MFQLNLFSNFRWIQTENQENDSSSSSFAPDSLSDLSSSFELYHENIFFGFNDAEIKSPKQQKPIAEHTLNFTKNYGNELSQIDISQKERPTETNFEEEKSYQEDKSLEKESTENQEPNVECITQQLSSETVDAPMAGQTNLPGSDYESPMFDKVFGKSYPYVQDKNVSHLLPFIIFKYSLNRFKVYHL